MRSDNGTEFTNVTLKTFFESLGIKDQFSAAKTPQQNGVVERRNHTLVEAVRTMLAYSKLSMFLWAEAISTACITQNRSIITKHHTKTPYEIINKCKPNVKFLRVFYCRCFVLKDREKLGKFDTKATEAVFIKYSQQLKVYRVYLKSNHKVMESANVSVDEAEDNSSTSLSSNLITLPSTSTTNTTPTSELDTLFELIFPDLLFPPLSNASSFVNADIPSPPVVQQTNTELSTSIESTSESSLEITQQHPTTKNPITSTEDQTDFTLSHLNDHTTPSLESFDNPKHESEFVDTSYIDQCIDPVPHHAKWTRSHPTDQILGTLMPQIKPEVLS